MADSPWAHVVTHDALDQLVITTDKAESSTLMAKSGEEVQGEEVQLELADPGHLTLEY